ncbi:MAG: hypothetical protein R3C60_04240 [Parvularculaceae bacterium]
MLKIIAPVAAFATAALILSANPAFAGERDDQVTMCASALEAQGLTNGGDYLARFEKARGSLVQTLTVKLIPTAGGDTLTGVCKIKKGEVQSAEIKA